MTHASRLLAAVGLLSLALSCGSREDPATMVFTNGVVWTGDDEGTVAEAVAVRGDRIVRVGSDGEIGRYVGDDTRVVDLGGRFLMPGFIDAHAHFLGIGRARMRLDLRGARTWDEIVETVRRAASEAEPGEWILGRGWHQEKWDRPPEPNVDGLPFHHALSAVSPENPVLLTHASGHGAIANSAAMKAAGVGAGTPDPEGGTILRDAGGEPVGVFRESAENLLLEALDGWRAERSPEERRGEETRAALLAQRECLSKGITSLHDGGSTFAEIDLLRDLVLGGDLRIRLYVMVEEPNDSLAARLSEYRLEGIGGGRLTVRAVKRWIDGALGSHGAWLLEPYDDLPSTSGLNTEPIPAMMETAFIALENGFQLCTHAIGDRANRATLDLYEEAFGGPDRGDRRWRIEHAQHVHPDDVPRFAGLGVIAAMQGIHCTSDGAWVPKRIGERRAAESAYVWRSLIDAGAILVNGTDAPVEDVDPIACFHASVTRRMKDGTIFHGDQRMTREEALRSYTRNAAYAAFEEALKGSLAPGKLADLVVLSKNLLTLPDDEIPGAKVVATLVGGEVLFGALPPFQLPPPRYQLP